MAHRVFLIHHPDEDGQAGELAGNLALWGLRVARGGGLSRSMEGRQIMARHIRESDLALVRWSPAAAEDALVVGQVRHAVSHAVPVLIVRVDGCAAEAPFGLGAVADGEDLVGLRQTVANQLTWSAQESSQVAPAPAPPPRRRWPAVALLVIAVAVASAGATHAVMSQAAKGPDSTTPAASAPGLTTPALTTPALTTPALARSATAVPAVPEQAVADQASAPGAGAPVLARVLPPVVATVPAAGPGALRPPHGALAPRPPATPRASHVVRPAVGSRGAARRATAGRPKALRTPVRPAPARRAPARHARRAHVPAAESAARAPDGLHTWDERLPGW